ncbi:MAG: nucleotidyltransferase family protein [Alphaproteobacteria bacterium]|nr:nucleotidyltransferase family protein [Alphaproteobacteria bacterium]
MSVDQDASSFLRLVLRNPINRALLERLPRLGLPDSWLVAGCLFQTVWNIAAKRNPTADIKDYDIFYFDDRDLSWEAEDREIRRVQGDFSKVPAVVEVKNQARVHLWYGKRFGPGYPVLRSSKDGIDRFLVRCTCVAVRADGSGTFDVYAPYGLEERHRGELRPNPANQRPDLFFAKAESYRLRWPWLTVDAVAA